MPRSSSRHRREIYGVDSAGETAPEHGEKPNDPPIEVEAPNLVIGLDLIVEVGDSGTHDMTQYNRGGPAAGWLLLGSPAWISIGNTTGLLTWTDAVDEAGTIQVIAFNSGGQGSDTFDYAGLPVDESLYVNPELAGGAPSGPSDGNNPPTSHSIGFNTANSHPEDNGDGTFTWVCNPDGDSGRTYLGYTVHNHLPALPAGTEILYRVWAERVSGSGGTTAAVAVSGTNDVQIVSNDSSVPNGTTKLCTLRMRTTGPGFTAQLRTGTGVTNNRTEHIRIWGPEIYTNYFEPPDLDITVDLDIDEGDDGGHSLDQYNNGGEATEWSMTGAPGWMSLDAQAGFLQWEDAEIGTGTVTITAENRGGVSTDTFDYTVAGHDPVVDTQPVDLTVTEPDGGAFTITASHPTGADLFYLWQASDGGAWENAQNVLSDASGATSTTLTLNSTTVADGAYDIRCRLRAYDSASGDNQTLSDVVSLTVDAP